MASLLNAACMMKPRLDFPCLQLVWFNHVIKTLWPHIGKVVFKQAVEQAGPQLDAICKQV